MCEPSKPCNYKKSRTTSAFLVVPKWTRDLEALKASASDNPQDFTRYSDKARSSGGLRQAAAVLAVEEEEKRHPRKQGRK